LLQDYFQTELSVKLRIASVKPKYLLMPAVDHVFIFTGKFVQILRSVKLVFDYLLKGFKVSASIIVPKFNDPLQQTNGENQSYF
jgi:hypothetical protein